LGEKSTTFAPFGEKIPHRMNNNPRKSCKNNVEQNFIKVLHHYHPKDYV
jgi:hypothetical protein